MKSALQTGQCLLGLDVGQKNIGLAISDTSLTIATPTETLKRVKFSQDVQILQKFITKHQVGGLVMGLPLHMDGGAGRSVQSVRQFAKNVQQHIDLPVVFWDERLSTHAVTRTLLAADMSRAKRGAVVDKMAAAFILQGVLDLLKNL